MLVLEDRLRVALGAGMGVQLDTGDVEVVCRFIVVLRQIENERLTANGARKMAQAALKKMEDR